MFAKFKAVVSDPFVRQTAKELVGAVVVTAAMCATTVFVKVVMSSVMDAVTGKNKPVEQN